MKRDLIQRKVRKLFRNPKQFFADSKAVKNLPMNKANGAPIKNEVSNVLGSIFFNDVDCLSLNLNKQIKPLNYDFSSIIVKERRSSQPKNEPIYSNILSNPKNFIGFRERNVVLLDAPTSTIESYLDLKVLQEKPWNDAQFNEYRNIFIVDPRNNLPLLLKSTSPFLNVHCIFTEKVEKADIERCIKWSGMIDVCILHSKHEINIPNIKKTYSFSSTNQLLYAINNIILIHGSKPYDLLVPSFGKVPYIDDIDTLNESGCDVYIKLKKKISCTGHKKSFSDLVEHLSNNVDYILCRESIMQRYDNLVTNGDMINFISQVSYEGYRLEIDHK
ncbi:hypothetical protein [Aeromonas veronii]|uniref:hypothetical protein n=1 Tax=Aeromonas veronii TaxID=654 RepID=UPI001F257D11|nr:hypothetical protein [Aeromonas veronii]MCF5866927.1 hypothetical protein [Aeromonas veronii]